MPISSHRYIGEHLITTYLAPVLSRYRVHLISEGDIHHTNHNCLMLKRPPSHTPTPTRSTFEEAGQNLLPIASSVLASFLCNPLVTSPLLSPSPCVFGEHKVDFHQNHQYPTKRQRLLNQEAIMDNLAEAGPSKQPFLLRTDSSGIEKSLSTNSSMNKPRKRPARLALNPGTPSKRNGEVSPGSRSVPASPMVGEHKAEEVNRQGPVNDLRDTLCGAPRRRPSVLFANRAPALPLLNIPSRSHSTSKKSAVPNSGPPAIWQDPSEHILSGKGSSLQHARSVYASGPIEVLPGLFLGDEFNARDEQALARLGITTILNVAKETTLPCQNDEGSHDLGFLRQSVNLSRGLERRLTLNDEAATPTSSRPPVMNADEKAGKSSDSPPMTGTHEKFFTPVTSLPPALMSPAPPVATKIPSNTSSSRPSSLYLRNTSSTPNLNVSFQNPRQENVLPGSYRSGNDSSSDEDEEEEMGDDETEEGGESAATSSLTSHLSSAPSEVMDSLLPHDDRKQLSPSDFSVTTPSSSTFSRKSPAMANTSISSSSSTSASSSAGSYTIALPNDAIALSVPPSPTSNRTWPIRYIKLPWTHDETDLAGLSSTGGFVTGCAIIADALGIDLRTGRMTPRLINAKGSVAHDRRSGVLIHCQCGVSRSATLVIAFVMQAAAYEYDFEKTRNLTGMHDCYEMVKGLSSSISPNISLIYQLVEWERLLSSQVAMQIDQHTAVKPEGDNVDMVTATEVAHQESTAGRGLNGGATGSSTERRWGKEVMGEEDWMKMRAEEERKEREEEAEKEKKMEEVKAREAEWRAAQGLKASVPNAKSKPKALQLAVAPNLANNGVGGRRKKPSPSLTLVSSSKTNADRALGLSGAKTAVTLLAPTNEENEDVVMSGSDEVQADTASNSEKDQKQSRNSTIFPWLKGQQKATTGGMLDEKNSTNSDSSSRPGSRPNSGYGASAFGVMGQSAAERRIKHKRTFSAEVPDWNSRQSVLSRSKTLDGANKLSTLSSLAVSATEETPPCTADL